MKHSVYAHLKIHSIKINGDSRCNEGNMAGYPNFRVDDVLDLFRGGHNKARAHKAVTQHTGSTYKSRRHLSTYTHVVQIAPTLVYVYTRGTNRADVCLQIQCTRGTNQCLFKKHK